MSLDASTDRSRTPPDLKWLLNQRAAYLGSLQQAEARAASLRQKVSQQEVQLAKSRASLKAAQDAALSFQGDIRALDVVLDVMHRQANKDAISPVKAWAGRYGARGAQRQFIMSFLQAAAPYPVKTVSVVDALQHKFDLAVETPKERDNLRYSVRKTLRLLRDVDGLVESLHVRKKGTPDGLWRWKESAPTLGQLRARTQERGDDLAEDRPDGEVGRQ